jgi:hypothetical protein
MANDGNENRALTRSSAQGDRDLGVWRFLKVREAARRMMPHGHGVILLTGASVKGYPRSAAFAMGKFALRGLAQSTARELGPKGTHVAHFVIDGGVRVEGGRSRQTGPAACSIPTQSPRLISRYCASHAAVLARWRSSTGRGGSATRRGMPRSAA